MSEVSSEHVNREEYLYPPIEYNVITSQIMDYKLCIVGQRWKYTLLLIGFVRLYRRGHLLDTCVRTTYSIGEREVVSLKQSFWQ